MTRWDQDDVGRTGAGQPDDGGLGRCGRLGDTQDERPARPVQGQSGQLVDRQREVGQGRVISRELDQFDTCGQVVVDRQPGVGR